VKGRRGRNQNPKNGVWVWWPEPRLAFRLTAWIGNRKLVKEDFGAHDFARKKSNNEIISRSDTLKSAATDCIKRCAHQLGVGLHLYSKDGSYRSFRLTPAKPPAAAQPLEEAKEGT
jgi:hypothetical protein